MNLQCTYIVLSFIIFVKFKSSEAKKIESKKGSLPTDNRRLHTYHRLDFPQFNYYYNLLNRPFLNRHLYKLLKNKNHHEDIPFVDLTRDESIATALNYGNINKFSDDYIDISELARYATTPAGNKKVTYKLKPEQNKKVLIDIHGNTYQILKMLDGIARRMVPYQQRSNVFQSDTDESTSSSESDNPKANSDNLRDHNLENEIRTRYIPKRFQVINNNSGETKSDDDEKVINVSVETSSDTDKRLQGISNSETSSDENSASDAHIYIQSPTRYVKTTDMEWRRRLKNFLPKRVHWNEKDFRDLRNYWIAGPRGQYPAQYKTPY